MPETSVRVVLFGWWLDEVILVGFTSTDSCANTLMNITQADFTIQTEKRLVVLYSFPETHTIFKVCIKQKPRENKDGETIEMPYVMVFFPLIFKFICFSFLDR